jgi:hypothetical protein
LLPDSVDPKVSERKEELVREKEVGKDVALMREAICFVSEARFQRFLEISRIFLDHSRQEKRQLPNMELNIVTYNILAPNLCKVTLWILVNTTFKKVFECY